MPARFASRPSLHLALIAACALLPLDAMAMRCGNYLITKGDTQAKVLKYCGQPAQTTQRLGLRSGVYLNSGARRSGDPEKDLLYSRGHFVPYGQREVLVEDWVFNFGPGRLMRQVTFENGIVEHVAELGYGYRE
jgi:hypothetical protein